jgi:hypothetical protein
MRFEMLSFKFASRAKTLSLAALLIMLAGQASLAQKTYKVRNILRAYDLTVRVKSCGDDADTCSGEGRVSIFKKGAGTPFQVLSLPNVEIYNDTVAYNPEINANRRGLYAEEYSFIADDFNFDGREDLAICNGRESGYSGPSYTVFLFNARSKRFVENKRLSELAEGPYLGLFFVDAKKRQLVAYSKSGCCFHETDKYKVVGDRPVLVEKTVEDAMGSAGYVVTTTKRLVNGRWVKRVRKEKIKDEN